MVKKALTLAVAIGVSLSLASCSKEIKPEKKGGWVVQDGKLAAMPAIIVDQDFTPEGFAVNYFTTDPTVTVTTSHFYFILYGDYKPYDLKEFIYRKKRYTQNSSKPPITEGLEVSLMKGETQMYKVQITRPLPEGVYVLEARQGPNTVSFPFNILNQ
jgi:hypothetical protein